MISLFNVVCLVVIITTMAYRDENAPKLRMVQVTPPKSGIRMKPIMTSFVCDGRPYGYYADVENDCTYFHICHQIFKRDGTFLIKQNTFKCPDDTTFDQELLSCEYDVFVSPCTKSNYNSNKRFTTPAPWYPETTTEGEVLERVVVRKKGERKTGRKTKTPKLGARKVPAETD